MNALQLAANSRGIVLMLFEIKRWIRVRIGSFYGSFAYTASFRHDMDNKSRWLFRRRWLVDDVEIYRFYGCCNAYSKEGMIALRLGWLVIWLVLIMARW